MPVAEQLVFVYGTLMRGQVNHPWLAGARAEGDAQLPGALLHDLGPFPMAVAGAGVVHGEVYAVTAAGLARLDRLEGHPRLYRRQRLTLADGRRVWVYLGQPRQVRHSPLLASGRWLPAGRWPASGPAALAVKVFTAALATALAAGPQMPHAIAGDTTALCRTWQSSQGTARILLGNAIGAAHYLTRDQRLAESPDDHPRSLYRHSDLLRACGGR